MFIGEEKNVEIGGNKFLIRAFPATKGLEVMNRLEDYANGIPSATFMKEVILTSATINNKHFTSEMFDEVFSRKYKQAMDLFTEIIEFNFGSEDENSPNTESDTEGQ